MNKISQSIYKRVAPVSHQIGRFLKNSGLPATTFCHDMTFGNGMGCMLQANAELITRFYTTRHPFVFTNNQGRTLKNGAYLSKYTIDPIPEYEKLSAWVRESFPFQHMLSIAANEKDQQQLYTFFFDCPESQFMHHIINHYYLYQRFIDQYHLQFKDAIEIEREKHQAQFPLSDMALPNNFTLSVFDDKNKNELFFPKNIISDVVSILSPQQTKCLSLLGQGMTARDIALNMQLSVRTVEHYIAAIKQKLNVKNTKELIAKYASF